MNNQTPDNHITNHSKDRCNYDCKEKITKNLKNEQNVDFIHFSFCRLMAWAYLVAKYNTLKNAVNAIKPNPHHIVVVFPRWAPITPITSPTKAVKPAEKRDSLIRSMKNPTVTLIKKTEKNANIDRLYSN